MSYNVRMRTSRLAGFTLVEMIAILVVIIILAAAALDHYGTVSSAAKNAMIDNFLKDCKTVYAKMYYGDSSSNFQGTNYTSLANYVTIGGFDAASATLSGNQLTISGIPITFFKNQATSLVIDYGAQTFNGDNENTFLGEAHW